MTTAATRGARGRQDPDVIRAKLVKLGLREEIKPISGYAYTYWKHPTTAVSFYAETHGGAEAHRFYIHPRMFILAH